MIKKQVFKALQERIAYAKYMYELGCTVSYDTALSKVNEALKWYRFLTGKKYTLNGQWQVVESK